MYVRTSASTLTLSHVHINTRPPQPAQYRTVLTAAALTPWMDANVVKPYLAPIMDKMKKD